MSDLKQFQVVHGRAWSELVQSNAFGAALSLATSEKLKAITSLTDEEIRDKGIVILSDLRGHLCYESGLLGLHEKKEFVFQDVGEEQYPSPIEEALEESAGGVQPVEETATRPAPDNVSQSLFQQKKLPKKRGRPKGKKAKV